MYMIIDAVTPLTTVFICYSDRMFFSCKLRPPKLPDLLAQVHYLTSSQLEEFYDDYYSCPVEAFNTQSIDFAKVPLAKYRMQERIIARMASRMDCQLGAWEDTETLSLTCCAHSYTMFEG